MMDLCIGNTDCNRARYDMQDIRSRLHAKLFDCYNSVRLRSGFDPQRLPLVHMSIIMSRRRCGDNAVWDNRGREELRITGNFPVKQSYPRASLWICAEGDITEDFLNSFTIPPLIVICKDERCPEVEAACRGTDTPAPKLFNIGYHRKREETFFNDILPSVKEALDNGRDAVIHCRAGVHRAALSYCFVTMHIQGCSFDKSSQSLELIRAVKIDEILRPSCRRNGTWTEDHMQYLHTLH